MSNYWMVPIDAVTGNPIPLIECVTVRDKSPYTFASYDDADLARRWVCDGPGRRSDFDRSGWYHSHRVSEEVPA